MGPADAIDVTRRGRAANVAAVVRHRRPDFGAAVRARHRTGFVVHRCHDYCARRVRLARVNGMLRPAQAVTMSEVTAIAARNNLRTPGLRVRFSAGPHHGQCLDAVRLFLRNSRSSGATDNPPYMRNQRRQRTKRPSTSITKQLATSSSYQDHPTHQQSEKKKRATREGSAPERKIRTTVLMGELPA